MRIVAGQYGGRRLLVPKGRDIRPTSDKVRGAIFNALVSRGAVHGARVLDGFCGTGALGLEALSRGASHCTFIDKNRTSLELARSNALHLGALDACNFLLRDMLKPEKIKQEASFDLVFLDPPYAKGLLIPVLSTLHKKIKITPDCLVVAEVEKNFRDEIAAPNQMIDERTYGETKIMFLTYQSAPE